MNLKLTPFRVLRAAVLSAAWLLPIAGFCAADDIVMLNESGVRERLEHWIAPFVAEKDFSGVILIAQGNRLIAQQAYGKADFAHNRPNTPDTRFRIASLSKTFTAAAIERLIVEGKISLQDTLSHFISGMPNGDTITIRQLLLHASGIGVLDSEDAVRHCLPNETLLKRLRVAKPLFKPGEKSEYSNEGYFLLAQIIEKVSGLSYEQYMRRNVFEPLNMRNSGSACQHIPSGNNASGHVTSTAASSVQQVAFDEAMQPGPGSIYSNAADLYKWLVAVDTDPRFKDIGGKYAYGWGTRNYSGKALIEQSGIVEGFDAHMAIYPEEHIYAVVLSNIQSGLFNRIPADLEAVLFDRQPSRPPVINAVTVSSKALEDYAGSFVTEIIPVPLNVSAQNGVLYIHWGENPMLRVLTPVGKDEFFFRAEYAKVRFLRDETGRVVSSTWQWPQGDPISFKRQ